MLYKNDIISPSITPSVFELRDPNNIFTGTGNLMHRSFFAVKDTFINSGSNFIDGTTFQDKNTGQDEVLELKKVYHDREFKHPTRMLIQFDANEIKNYITSSNVPVDYKLVLKLFETAGTSGLSKNYTIAAYPLNESWDEGIGKE